MEINYFQYQATMKKIHDEAVQTASSLLQGNEVTREYFGDENAVKIRRHNGKVLYYVTEELVEELLQWTIMQQQALAMIVSNSNEYNTLTKKEKACISYIASLKPDDKYLKSLRKAVRGDFVLDFYRDEEKINAEKRFSEEKSALFSEKWGF